MITEKELDNYDFIWNEYDVCINPFPVVFFNEKPITVYINIVKSKHGYHWSVDKKVEGAKDRDRSLPFLTRFDKKLSDCINEARDCAISVLENVRRDLKKKTNKRQKVHASQLKLFL